MEKKKGSNKKNKKTKKTIKKSVKKARKYSKYNLFFIPLRYFILFILALSLPIIYKILTPLTVYTSAFLLNLFFDTVIIKGNFIILDLETIIELIPACIAGSAYLLLLILNLTIPMNAQKRFLSIIFSIIILFISNILRIVFLSILSSQNFAFFDITHKLFWYFFSTLFVVLIWFLTVKIYHIKEIPLYSDLKFLVKIIKKNKK